MRIAYLGPAGTFTEDALREAAPGGDFEPLRTATIHDAILAVERGEAERALVPFENSIEGSVRGTLDTLAFEAEAVTIVGEYDYAVRAHLIAREDVQLERAGGRSLPPAAARPVRPLPARAAARGRTAQRQQHRRRGADGRRVGAALGGDRLSRGGRALRLRDPARGDPGRGRQRHPLRLDRPRRHRAGGDGPWKTSLVFSELGEDHPGALVDALREFSDREINLTRIESRPLRQGLGRYMFFCDLEGAETDERRRRGDRALRAKAESVRMLGSYPLA